MKYVSAVDQKHKILDEFQYKTFQLELYVNKPDKNQ